MANPTRTKIICTIGPASRGQETLATMMRAGMNIARLNFSHGDHADHTELLRTIRNVALAEKKPIAILQDLQGPKVRVGTLPKEGIPLEKGSKVTLTTVANASLPRISVSHTELHTDINAGDILLLDDGLMKLTVESITDKDIVCTVIDGGILHSHKGLNVPTARLSIPAITEKDDADLRFGIAHGVDLVALSFVRDAEDIHDLKRRITEYTIQEGRTDEPRTQVIAKIEKHEAVDNIHEIIVAADGIMIARGDLGIEMPSEEVPIIQKTIISACLAAAKPVIVATQMLDSMIRNPRPTRAEVSDIANAVIDHTDAVMLSGESATGAYPVEAVTMMANTIRETEASAFDDLSPSIRAKNSIGQGEAAGIISEILSHASQAKAVIVTGTQESIRMVSRHRTELPVYAASIEPKAMRQAALSWGIVPIHTPDAKTDEDRIAQAIQRLLKEKTLQPGDVIVTIFGDAVTNNTHAPGAEIRQV